MSPTNPNYPLHATKPSKWIVFNRVFAALYTTAIVALVYRHGLKLLNSTTKSSLLISISMLISDLLLAFMWSTGQAFRMCPITREIFPENVEKVSSRKDFPALDVFICTADPYKEPPMSVVNTALSVMAYDYPTEKLSVYVSDDGGSQLTLFAFMEAVRFGSYWLPFCRENEIKERCPEAFFRSNYHERNSRSEKIKMMYENMNKRVEDVVESGKVTEYINTLQEHEAFSKWTEGFTSQEHPAVVQVLLDSDRDRDIRGLAMPNLVYVSREKSRTSDHHFKAGALNTLLRVSAIMTNAPIILTIDCDMFSNDPKTPHSVLCYFMGTSVSSKLAYIQFPQSFHGLNKEDIYSSEMKRWFHINPRGMDGLLGPDNMGTCCFFLRRALFGSPSSHLQPEMAILSPDYVVHDPIRSQQTLQMALHVAGCNFENNTTWGSEIGFRYGSLVEDFFTGYRLHSEGWKSIFCDPERPAFYGEAPISLHDAVNQVKRWAVGLLEVAFSKYSTLTFGMRNLGPVMSHCYSHYAFSPLKSIPITIYSFLPQLTLLNRIYIFPEVSDPWFFLYIFLLLGAYGQDCLDFILAKGTMTRWWNEQRIWLIRGLTCYLFGTIDYLMKQLSFSTLEFNVTNKVADDEQSKRYNEGNFEFGVPSPMFYPLATAAIINLNAFCKGFWQIIKGENMDGLFLQTSIAGYGVLNCIPIYEAMALRTDNGRMPTKITIIAVFLAWGLYFVTSFTLKV